jgi:hypothetical protein
MAGNPARQTPRSAEPVIHDLPSFNADKVPVTVHLATWRAEDGTWRGRLLFGSPDGQGPATADIFCAPSENELWESVRDLGEHHLRDLYRSLVR